MTEEKPSPEDTDKLKKAKKPTPGSKKEPEKQPEKELRGYEEAGLPEPTRFGDWEVKGRCSDF